MDDPPSIPFDSARGDAGDFESLLVSHQHRIYFFIRSMIFNPEDARDILQNVNAIMIRKRDRFRVNTDFKSWSFTIARFECLTYLRRHKAGRVVASEDLAEYLAEGAEDISEKMDSWLSALAHCRKLLSGENEKLLDLRYRIRVPLEEIALLWKVSEGSLKQKLFRVRKQLKACVVARISGGEA